jgi:hypothetical protein
MKKSVLILSMVFFLSSCAELLRVVEEAGEVTGATGITQSEAASGLRAALIKGTETGVNFLGKTDGFLKNDAYKILLPPEVREAESKIRNSPAGFIAAPYLDKVVTAMNRGAENAMDEAKPIFVNAIKSMSIQDAINIVTGGEGAATNYLKSKTTSQLESKFKPVIKKSLDKVNIRDPWSKVTTGYNAVMSKNVQTDLDQYVTDNAIQALFDQIRVEENKIRANPVERTSEILRKVFGYADRQKSN